MDGGRKHLRRASLALFAAIAALGAASAPAAAAPAGGSPAEVRDYWTIGRMLAAEQPRVPSLPMPSAADAAAATPDPGAASYVPADGAPAVLRAGRPGAGSTDGAVVRDEVTDPAAAAVRMHGKVFFTVLAGPDAGDRVCSGTVVNSRRRNVVWTAGHCVFDSAAGFVSNWVFVPGFSNEGAPYGEWPAKRLKTTPGWRTRANFRYDLGAAVVAKDPQGRRLQGLVGARGIGFDQSRDRSYEAYGYPTVYRSVEFPGTREYRCLSANAGADAPVGSGPATMAIDCDMPAGASGGGWISGKTLLSVTSYGYVNDPARLYGPYHSKAAKALYRKAAGKRKRKRRGGKRGGWTHTPTRGSGAS